MNIRLLFWGQSNAGFLAADGQQLVAAVEQYLGFDGTADTVQMIGGVGVSAIQGTPVLPSPFVDPSIEPWLDDELSDAAAPFAADAPLQTLLGDLAGDAGGAVKTFIIVPDGETDSLYPGITPQEWADATEFAVDQQRVALGLTAAQAPVLFLKVPYDEEDPVSFLQTYLDGGSAQAIQQGMQLLVDTPAFNASWGAWDGDANMDLTGPIGDQHLDATDQAQAIDRLARSIAELSAAYALPGSPIASGQVDDAGPAVAGAANVAGEPDQVDVQLALAAGSTGLEPLSAQAALGAGWTAQHGGVTLAATAAEILPGTTTLRLTFAGSVPADGSFLLFYGAGSGRIDVDDGAGQDAAVYDDQGLPVQGTPFGVTIAASDVSVPPAGGVYPMVQGGAATIGGTALNPVVTLGDSENVTVVADPANSAVALEVDNGTGTDAVVYGGAGFLTFDGGLGSGLVVGGAGGVDAAGGVGGANTLEGGSGDATFYGHAGDTIVGGGGTTTAWFIGNVDGGTSLGSPAIFFGGSGAATLGTMGAVDLVAVGGAGSLAITASTGANAIWGGAGDLTFFSRNGTDFLAGGSGATAVYCGAGSDTVFGGDAAASQLTVAGGSGTATVVAGAAGGVVFTGGSGAASAWQGGGSLTVDGGTDTELVGGSSAPAGSLVVDGGEGQQTVFGGAGTTTIDCSQVSTSAAMLFVGGQGQATVDSGAGPLAAFAGAGQLLVNCSGAGSSTIIASAAPLAVVDTGAGLTNVVASTGDITMTIGTGGAVALVIDKGAAGGTDVLDGFRAGVDRIFLIGFAPADVPASSSLAGGFAGLALTGGPDIVLPEAAAAARPFSFG